MKEEHISSNIESGKQKPRRKPVIIIILLVFLSILLVLTTLGAVFGYDVWRVAFNPPLVKQMLTDEFVNSPLVPRVLEDMSVRRAQERVESGESLSGVDEPDILLLLSFVAYEEWAQIKDLLVTDEFITHLVSVSVDGLYDWIDSDAPAPQFVWEMGELKQRLVGGQGEQAIMIAYGQLPECTPAEIDDFTSRLAAVPPGVEVLYNLCEFPDPWRDDQIDDYLNTLVDVNQNLPEEYDFGQMLGGMGFAGGNLTTLKVFLRLFRFAGHWGWVAPLSVLLLVLVIGVRSLGDAGKWLGIPLFISGGLVIGAAFFARVQLLMLATDAISAQISELLRTEVDASITRLSSHIFQPIYIQGGIILGVGVLLIIVMIITTSVKKKKMKATETDQIPE